MKSECDGSSNFEIDADDLPDGWKIILLKDVGEIITGNTPSRDDSTYYGGTIPWVKPPDLDREIPITTTTEYLSEKGASVARLVPQGSVLVSCIGNLGKVGLAGIDLTTNQQINSIIFNEKIVVPKFGYYFCKTMKGWLETNSSATTIPIINKKHFSNAPFVVPPLAEQQRIVACVEALLTHINSAREPLSRVPLIMKKFRQAVLAAACDGRLTEGWREKNPNVESGSQLIERIAGPDTHSIVPDDDDPPLTLPEIPETWEWSRCFPLCDPERNITYGVIKLGAPLKGGIPTLRSSDVRWLHIDNSDVKTIDPNIASQYSRTFLKGGEIVITVRGSLGGIAIVPQSMAGYNISREVAVLPIRSSLDAKYFCYAIASIWSQNWLSEVTKGVAYTGFNIRDLKRLPLPLPPLAEQHEIIRRVGLLFERADAFDKDVDAAGRRCERLTQAVLGKAFSGKL